MTLEQICVSVNEASQILGISKITVYRLISRGELPHRKIGNRILIDIETLQRFGKVGGETV